MMDASGYESQIVLAFMKAHGEARDTDGIITRLSGMRVADYHRTLFKKWAGLEIVPLDKVDSILMAYGFMTFELEAWATEHYGRDGFLDPNADPAELVA